MPGIAGTVRITINGVTQSSLPGAELELGGEERELVAGLFVYGTKAKIVPSKLTFSIPWMEGAPIESLRKAQDATAVFDSNVGPAYTIDNLSTLMPPKIKDGEASIEMGGDPAKPV